MTAVVLTMGEPTTARALASVRRQTSALRDVLVIESVSPFSAALNAGAGQVRTPFFIQVDADMTLDSDCVQRLSEAMSPEVGIAAGLLRDPLMGEVGAVKLFRRECFDAVQLRDGVATDVDFYRELAEHGWLTLYTLRELRPGRPRTLGEHRPVYSPAYTYATYYLLGARYWQLRDSTSLRWRLGRLRTSKHPLAPMARAALGHGLFSDEARDVPKDAVRMERAVLQGLARSDDAAELGRARIPATLAAEQACERFYDEGHRLGSRGAYAELRSWLRRITVVAGDGDALLEASLSHGFLSAVEGNRDSERPWQRLRELR